MYHVTIDALEFMVGARCLSRLMADRSRLLPSKPIFGRDDVMLGTLIRKPLVIPWTFCEDWPTYGNTRVDMLMALELMSMASLGNSC